MGKSSSIDSYENQANLAITFSRLAYLDFSLFMKKDTKERAIENLDWFISRREKNPNKDDRYLNDKSLLINGNENLNINLKDFLSDKSVEYIGIDNQNEYLKLKELIDRESPAYDNCVIKNISAFTKSYSQSTLEAVTIENGDELYIVYRGTGAGKWIDNGHGMYDMSEMQFEAVRYYQQMVSKYGKNKRIFITGHSKGGNLAQTALMYSPKGYLAEKVFSFDGQGFSNKAVKLFKERKDSNREYNKLTKKIFTIASSNDYVSPLGNKIVPDKNVFLITHIEGNPHAALALIYDGKLDFDRDPANGKIKSADKDPIRELVEKINKKLMQQDKKSIGEISLVGMAVINNIMGKVGYKDKSRNDKLYGTGTIRKIDKNYIDTFIEKGLGLIRTELNTPAGENALLEMKDKKMNLAGFFLSVVKDANPKLTDGGIKLLVKTVTASAMEKKEDHELPDVLKSKAFLREKYKYEDLMNEKMYLPDIDKMTPEETLEIILSFTDKDLIGKYIEIQEVSKDKDYVCNIIDRTKEVKQEREPLGIVKKKHREKNQKDKSPKKKGQELLD